jgi:ribosome-binding factor A
MRKRSGNPASQRQLRVGEEMRHILADILGRGEFHDLDLQNRAVTVTEVRVSPDLRNATAYVVPLGGDAIDLVMPALRRVTPYLRAEAGRRLQLRFVPRLTFELDLSFDQAARIEALLESPAVKRDLETSSETEATAESPSAPRT